MSTLSFRLKMMLICGFVNGVPFFSQLPPFPQVLTFLLGFRGLLCSMLQA